MGRALSGLWLRLPHFMRLLIRFGSVSATALIVDVSAYALLIPLIEPAALAAFIAYCTGGIWHYLLSTTLAFRQEMPNLSPAAQFARFVNYFASTLAGLTVTTLTVSVLVDHLSFHPYAGKMIAVPLSFLTVFTMVRLTVFARGGVGEAATPVNPRI